MTEDIIKEVEKKISLMKNDGKYYNEFCNLFGQTKRIHLLSDETIRRMNEYLINKGY